MKLRGAQVAALLRRVDKLEEAAVAVSFAVSQPPEERDDLEILEIEYQEARRNLVEYVRTLEVKDK